MRVAYVTGSLSRQAGGLLPAVSGTARALGALGADVEVFGTRDSDTERDRDAWTGIRAHALRKLGPYKLHLAPTLPLRLALSSRRAPFEVVGVEGLWLAVARDAWRYCRRRGASLVVTAHGTLTPHAWRSARAKKAVLRRLFVDALLRDVACFHFLNAPELAAAREVGCRGPACVVPTGVELAATPAPLLGEGDRPRTLLYLGRLHPGKGLGPLVDGWRRARRPERAWRLRIVGPDEGGLLPELRERARGDDTIELAGPVFGRAKLELLASASAFVLPSLSEGLPMAVLEALAAGLPLVMTRVCNVPEAFDGGAAIEIEPTPDSIAAGLERLRALDDPALVAMGARARAVAAEHYAWPVVARRLLDVYEWLRSGGARPSSVDPG